MGLANEVIAIAAEKQVIVVIERDGEVATNIFVGNEPSPESGEESFHRFSLASK